MNRISIIYIIFPSLKMSSPTFFFHLLCIVVNFNSWSPTIAGDDGISNVFGSSFHLIKTHLVRSHINKSSDFYTHVVGCVWIRFLHKQVSMGLNPAIKEIEIAILISTLKIDRSNRLGISHRKFSSFASSSLV